MLTAKAEGVKSAEVRIAARAVAPLPAVPPTEPIVALVKWRMSPLSAPKPNPNQQINDSDMNSWSPVTAGSTQKFEGGSWATFRLTFTPVANVQKSGGEIQFKEITGAAEVWVDGKLLAEKTATARGALKVALPAGQGARTVSVLVNSGGAAKAGLSGAVVCGLIVSNIEQAPVGF